MSTSEHEDPLPSLGQAEVLGVQDPPCGHSFGSRNHASVGPSSPLWRTDGPFASDQASQEGAEGVVLGAEDPGDVFPKDEGGGLSSIASKIVNCVRKADELHCEVAPGAAEGGPEAREREILTGGAAHEHVAIDDEALVAEAGEIAEVGNLRAPLDRGQSLDRVRPRAGLLLVDSRFGRIRHEPGPASSVALAQDGGGERVDFSVGQRLPPEASPGRCGRADTGAHADIFHAAPLRGSKGSGNGVELRAGMNDGLQEGAPATPQEAIEACA